MTRRFRTPLLVSAAGLLLSAPSLFATLIQGTLAITGSGPVAVNGNAIDFQPPVNPLGDGAGGFSIIGMGSSTGSFAGLAGTSGTVRDLSRTVVPVGSPTTFSNFITFTAPSASTWTITLTQLLPGVYGAGDCLSGPAGGQNCTPPQPGGSPFNLTNTTASTSTASFTFSGTATDTATGETSNVIGLFSTTFSNLNLQQIVGAIASGQTILTSWSATITAVPSPVIPEPGTLSLMAMGGILMVGSILSRKRKK